MKLHETERYGNSLSIHHISIVSLKALSSFFCSSNHDNLIADFRGEEDVAMDEGVDEAPEEKDGAV